MAPVLAGVAGTLVHLRLTQVAGVSGVTLAGEGVLPVYTVPMVARGGLAVIDVCLTA